MVQNRLIVGSWLLVYLHCSDLLGEEQLILKAVFAHVSFALQRVGVRDWFRRHGGASQDVLRRRVLAVGDRRLMVNLGDELGVLLVPKHKMLVGKRLIHEAVRLALLIGDEVRVAKVHVEVLHVEVVRSSCALQWVANRCVRTIHLTYPVLGIFLNFGVESGLGVLRELVLVLVVRRQYRRLRLVVQVVLKLTSGR